MEEKKNQTNGGGKNNKHRNHRRHGYFIEPAAQNQNAEIKEVTPDATANNVVANNEQKPKQNQNHKKHHQRSNQANIKQEQKTEQQPQQKNEQNKEQISSAPKHNKNNKNKPKNRPDNQQQNNTPSAPVEKIQEKNESQKSASVQKKKTPAAADRNNKQERPQISHNADEYETYRWFVEEEAPANDAPAEVKDDQPKTEVVGIRFKSTGKTYYFDPQGTKYAKGSGAIVDTARGQEFGEVAMANSYVKDSDIVPPLRHIIRAATKADVAHHEENKKKEDEAFRVCNERIAAHKLDMKLIEAQYTFDNSKLLFYFTSSDRVDFRDLVKDLASVFRTRIELRQIGIRDEAKLMGGLGMCGRPLCCSVFLSDFNQVSIKMAKEQNLSLNSAKISGICGRLMCCLKYEHEAYEYEIKRTPPVDSLVRTESGDGIITETSPLAGTVKVRLFSSPEAPPKTFKRDDIMMLRKKSGEKGDK